jgi:hypothetical protein
VSLIEWVKLIHVRMTDVTSRSPATHRALQAAKITVYLSQNEITGLANSSKCFQRYAAKSSA